MTVLPFFLALSLILAQNGSPPIPSQPPDCHQPAYHQFDFWLGDWDVYDLNGTLAGRNDISPQEKHCLIVEQWTGVSGSGGQSYNYYNPATQKWRQLWVSPAAVIDYEGQLKKPGVMELSGYITYRTGNTAPFKGSWRLQKDGSVMQEFLQYDEAEKTWKNWFTGHYIRHDSEEAK